MTTAQGTTVDARALERAIDQGLKARRISPRCWRVTSASSPGEYEVCLEAAIRCQCRAGINGRSCKHVALVEVLTATTDAAIQWRPGDAEYRPVGY